MKTDSDMMDEDDSPLPRKVNDIDLDEKPKVTTPKKKEPAPKTEQEKFQQILKQNISINKLENKDGFGKATSRIGIGYQDKKEKQLTDDQVKEIYDKIIEYNRD